MSEYVNLNEAVETIRLTLRGIYEKYADEVAKALEQDLRDLPTVQLGEWSDLNAEARRQFEKAESGDEA